MTRPKNAIVLLFDSLNRHMLGAYGSKEFSTPNFDRFAARSLRFTNHYTGALPCMPARHDILCGAWDFLWKAWGSIELWEDAITYALSKSGVVSQLISDHPHLFETGGENYHVDFTAWDYLRGHEGDAWKTVADPSWLGAPTFGRKSPPYDKSRGWFKSEADFPGPKTMSAAARWLDENAGKHERFFLFVDEFDPHEPFDTPEHYSKMYDPEWQGANLIWPPYAVNGVATGVLTAAQGRQIRAQYGAKLTMIDAWFGRVLDMLDRHNMWADTAIYLCTDHGHYLGEKDIWGKPGAPAYQTIANIPMMIAAPGVPAGTCDALTTSVDIFAALCDQFGVVDQVRQKTHGRSLWPLLDNSASSIRDYVLSGVWGREVHFIDGQHKYARAPNGTNRPLSMSSNRWSTMPTHFLTRENELPLPDHRATLGRMPGATVPVIHQSWDQGDRVPFWAYAKFSGNHVFDLKNDPGETRNLVGDEIETNLATRLRDALKEIEAPAEQFVRLGL